MSLLSDGRLAKTVANALKGIFYEVSIKRTTPGGYDPSTGTVSTGTTVTHVAHGMVDAFSPTEIAAGIVTATDRKVTLLATTLAITPTPVTDVVTVDGADLTIISVTSDPAKATWTLQVR